MYKYIRTLLIDGKKEKIEITDRNRRIIDRLVDSQSIQDLGTEIVFEGPACIKCKAEQALSLSPSLSLDRLTRKDSKGSIVDRGFICPKCGSIVWGVEF